MRTYVSHRGIQICVQPSCQMPERWGRFQQYGYTASYRLGGPMQFVSSSVSDTHAKMLAVRAIDAAMGAAV